MFISERLTNYDESLFTKDADINNVDPIENGNCTGSSSSTLQNSTDSTSNLSKHDGTFVAPPKSIANGTFDADLEVDKTFIQAPDANGSNNISIKNSTFELGNKANQTFETQKKCNKLGITIPIVADLDDEELSLCESFNATKTFKRSDNIANLSSNFLPDQLAPDMNSTFQLDGKKTN